VILFDAASCSFDTSEAESTLIGEDGVCWSSLADSLSRMNAGLLERDWCGDTKASGAAGSKMRTMFDSFMVLMMTEDATVGVVLIESSDCCRPLQFAFWTTNEAAFVEEVAFGCWETMPGKESVFVQQHKLPPAELETSSPPFPPKVRD